MARKREIGQAIEKLRYAPLRCAAQGDRHGHTYRRLVAGGCCVYYRYTAPQGMETCGTLSIRAVKHSGGDAGIHEGFCRAIEAVSILGI